MPNSAEQEYERLVGETQQQEVDLKSIEPFPDEEESPFTEEEKTEIAEFIRSAPRVPPPELY